MMPATSKGPFGVVLLLLLSAHEAVAEAVVRGIVCSNDVSGSPMQCGLDVPWWPWYTTDAVLLDSYALTSSGFPLVMNITRCGVDEKGGYCEELSRDCPGVLEDMDGNLCPGGLWDQALQGPMNCTGWCASRACGAWNRQDFVPACGGAPVVDDVDGGAPGFYQEQMVTCTEDGPFLHWRYRLLGEEHQHREPAFATSTLSCAPNASTSLEFHLLPAAPSGSPPPADDPPAIAEVIVNEDVCPDHPEYNVTAACQSELDGSDFYRWYASTVLLGSFSIDEGTESVVTRRSTRCGVDEKGGYCEELSTDCPGIFMNQTFHICPDGLWNRTLQGPFNCTTHCQGGSFCNNWKRKPFVLGCLADAVDEGPVGYQEERFSCTEDGPFYQWRYRLEGAYKHREIASVANTVSCLPSPNARIEYSLRATSTASPTAGTTASPTTASPTTASPTVAGTIATPTDSSSSSARIMSTGVGAMAAVVALACLAS